MPKGGALLGYVFVLPCVSLTRVSSCFQSFTSGGFGEALSSSPDVSVCDLGSVSGVCLMSFVRSNSVIPPITQRPLEQESLNESVCISEM